MIPRTQARKLFIAVNNPWICSVNEDPVVMSNDLLKIFEDTRLTQRLQIKPDFCTAANDNDESLPFYKVDVYLEAVGTTTAINIGKITEVSVKDLNLIMKIDDGKEMITISLPTDCEDLDGLSYRLKKKEFETGRRLE